MTRMLISLEETDRHWLEQQSRESGVPMSEVVRQAIRRAQESEQKSMKDLLASTKGLWRGGDALRYQRRVRKEWR
jgi:Arc/MetJ-type ribon-helix-helix transcriptional regulator